MFALLFVADGPATPEALALALELTVGQVEQALEVLAKNLKKKGPLHVVQLAGGYQLATKPEFGQAISTFLRPQRQRLSKSLMEVLAIVAYKQPMTIAEIEEIRGVQSDYSVKSLLERRLLQEVGRKPTPGRPVLYGTSAQFLHQFKMNDLNELPELDLTEEPAVLSLPAEGELHPND